MCLAVPMKVTEVTCNELVVELNGVRQRARRDLIDDEQVAVGQHVIVHAGYAITVLDDEEAAATLALFAELEAAQAGDAP